MSVLQSSWVDCFTGILFLVFDEDAGWGVWAGCLMKYFTGLLARLCYREARLGVRQGCWICCSTPIIDLVIEMFAGTSS